MTDSQNLLQGCKKTVDLLREKLKNNRRFESKNRSTKIINIADNRIESDKNDDSNKTELNTEQVEAEGDF